MKTLKIIAVAVLVFTSIHARAYASLGENSDSVERDRQSLRGTKKITNQNSYQIHEITSNSVTVREYVAGNGTVFGVAWNGVGEPDLSQLFGSYFQEYKSAEPHASHASRRAPLKITSENITVEKSGHMRAIRGKAYVLKLIPAGVSVNEIQ